MRCYVWVMRSLYSLVCLLAILCASCGQREDSLAAPPEKLGGGLWTRGPIERPPLDAAPAAIRPFQPSQWLRATYGNGSWSIDVEIYRMPGESSAFEARQKWLGQAGTASMNHGGLFVVARSDPGRVTELGGFLRLLEGEWLRAVR